MTMSNVRPHRIEMERLFCIKVSSSTMVNWRTGQEIRLTCHEGTSRRDRECGVKGGYRLVFLEYAECQTRPVCGVCERVNELSWKAAAAAARARIRARARAP